MHLVQTLNVKYDDKFVYETLGHGLVGHVKSKCEDIDTDIPFAFDIFDSSDFSKLLDIDSKNLFTDGSNYGKPGNCYINAVGYDS